MDDSSTKPNTLFEDLMTLADVAKEVSSDNPYLQERGETADLATKAWNKAALSDDPADLEALVAYGPQVCELVKRVGDNAKHMERLVEQWAYRDSVKAEADADTAKANLALVQELAKKMDADRQQMAFIRDLIRSYLQEKKERKKAEAENEVLRQQATPQPVQVVQAKPSRLTGFLDGLTQNAGESLGMMVGPMVHGFFQNRREDRLREYQEDLQAAKEEDEHKWRLSTDPAYRAQHREYWLQMTAAGENEDASRREVLLCQQELNRREYEERKEKREREAEERERRYAREDGVAYQKPWSLPAVKSQPDPRLDAMFERHEANTRRAIDDRMDGLSDELTDRVSDLLGQLIPASGRDGRDGRDGKDGRTLLVDVPAGSSLKNNLT